MSEQEGEVVVDSAFAVVEVGVADAARLHSDERFAGAGIGDDDGFDRDGFAFARRDNAFDLINHNLASCALDGVEGKCIRLRRGVFGPGFWAQRGPVCVGFLTQRRRGARLG